MSPIARNSMLVRDVLIRRLAPFTIRATGLSRPLALELLASLSADERHLLFTITRKAIGMKNRRHTP